MLMFLQKNYICLRVKKLLNFKIYFTLKWDGVGVEGWYTLKICKDKKESNQSCPTSHNPTQRCTNIRNNIYQSLINFHAQKKPCESVSPCRHPDSRQLFSSQTQTAEMKGRAVLTA